MYYPANLVVNNSGKCDNKRGIRLNYIFNNNFHNYAVAMKYVLSNI